MNPFLYHYLNMWRKPFDFSGRTGVAGFWCAALVSLAVNLVLALFGLAQVYAIIALVPMLAMTVRRLHDGGVNWMWIALAVVPVLGWVALIVMLLKPGK